jgi:hypothetical protein
LDLSSEGIKMIDSSSTHIRWGGLAAGLLLVAAGCSDPLAVNDGQVRFVLSSGASVEGGDAAATPLQDGPLATGDHDDDRPSRFFQSAQVTFSSILARNLAGELVDVTIDLPVTVDVVTMEGGREIAFPDGVLPPATYDQVVVVIAEVQVIKHDGTTITMDPPGGGWTAIVPICPFEVGGDGTTTVGIQFDLKQAFSWRDNRYHFKPRFDCGEDEPEA